MLDGVNTSVYQSIVQHPGPEEVAKNYNSDSSNSAGVFALSTGYKQKDMDLFYNDSAPQVPKGTHPTFDPIEGADRSDVAIGYADESDMDLDVIYSLVYPKTVTHVFFSPSCFP